MGARPRSIPTKALSAKPVARDKTAPTKVQVYLSKPGLGAALAREAGFRKMSLSQAAEAILERGLKGRIEADADDRLLTLERRLSDHMRLTARDLFMLEELTFIALRTLISRVPEHPGEQDATYRAGVDMAMEAVLDELSRKVRAGRLQFEQALRETETPAPSSVADPANDAQPLLDGKA
jgi:hypothetical protein